MLSFIRRKELLLKFHILFKWIKWNENKQIKIQLKELEKIKKEKEEINNKLIEVVKKLNKLYDDYNKNRGRLIDILKLLFQRLYNKDDCLLSIALNTWKKNVERIKFKTAGEKISRFIENKYKKRKVKYRLSNKNKLFEQTKIIQIKGLKKKYF